MSISLIKMLSEKFGLSPNATEEEADALALQLVNDKKMTLAEYAKHSQHSKEGEPDESDPLNRIAGIVKSAVAPIADRVAKLEGAGVQAAAIDAAAGKAASMLEGRENTAPVNAGPDPEQIMAKGADNRGQRIEFKAASDRYSKSKSNVFYGHGKLGEAHPMADKPVVLDFGKQLEYASEAERALVGSWLKVHIARQLKMGHLINEHDMKLFQEALHVLDFCGDIATMDNPQSYYIGGRKLVDIERKTVFGGAGDASGGQNLVPQVLELEIIRASLLNNELAPYVTHKTVTKGTSVDTPTMVNLTISSGTTESTAISAQSTASLLSKLNSIFFAAVGELIVGRDFLADITPNFMQEVTDSWSEQLATWLDDQIANGDGTTEPLGIFNASGTTTITQQSPSPTGWDVTDVEALLFGVGKQYRANKGPSLRYVMNDTNYQRIRRLPLSSTDQRRLFGMTQEDYKLLGRPVGIQNSIANTKAAFVDLLRYYLWRRQGMEIRMTDQGKTLFEANSVCFVLRARYAGRLVLGEAMAQITTVPA